MTAGDGDRSQALGRADHSRAWTRPGGDARFSGVSIFGGLKDRTVSIAARQLLATRLTPYGQMLNFQLDSQTKTVTLELLLKGESAPIRVTLAGYEILDGGSPRLQFGGATASREWVEVLLNQFVVNRPIELPANLVPVLKLLV